MTWVRLHTKPKACRIDPLLWGEKEHYLYDKSVMRYRLTVDGAYLSEVIGNMRPEIGRYESVRFIDNN